MRIARNVRDAAFRILGLGAAGIAAALACASPALAQNDAMTPIEIPAQPGAIVLDTGPLPGAAAPETWHRQ